MVSMTRQLPNQRATCSTLWFIGLSYVPSMMAVLLDDGNTSNPDMGLVQGHRGQRVGEQSAFRWGQSVQNSATRYLKQIEQTMRDAVEMTDPANNGTRDHGISCDQCQLVVSTSMKGVGCVVACAPMATPVGCGLICSLLATGACDNEGLGGHHICTDWACDYLHFCGTGSEANPPNTSLDKKAKAGETLNLLIKERSSADVARQYAVAATMVAALAKGDEPPPPELNIIPALKEEPKPSVKPQAAHH
eukprot:TRINITY_DN7774_c1_g3_i1.p1 TRINITY_DN7774_c1_g3~~TRINITY_DN7774_c1_g3_i1.p1  ORF type:complete len:278 (-),score=22.12 TRINITY_DN7774_c1_g3_i1:112-855(-)